MELAEKTIKNIETSNIFKSLSIKLEKFLKWILKQENTQNNEILTKFFFFDYFFISTILVFIFVLLNILYLSNSSIYVQTHFRELEMCFATIFLSNSLFYLFSWLYFPKLSYFVSFILSRDSLVTKICIITNGICFIYFLHSFLMPKYDQRSSFYTFVNILILIALNGSMCFVYIFLFTRGIIQKFNSGMLSGFLLVFSPLLIFIVQLVNYIVLDFIMNLVEPLKTYVREKILKDKCRILEEIKKSEKKNSEE